MDLLDAAQTRAAAQTTPCPAAWTSPATPALLASGLLLWSLLCFAAGLSIRTPSAGTRAEATDAHMAARFADSGPPAITCLTVLALIRIVTFVVDGWNVHGQGYVAEGAGQGYVMVPLFLGNLRDRVEKAH